MPPGNFNQTIKFWIDELDGYSVTQLRTKPSPGSWSIGQVYMHLIENTQWFLEQVTTCMSTDSNSSEDAIPAGRTMLLKDDFPDELLEGPPENADTQQPETKEQLVQNLKDLQTEINRLANLISKNSLGGKTKHPGLGYFNAVEWFQFAEMHFRHHLRQKKRIDEFLENLRLKK